VDMTHLAATPIGMRVTAGVELVEITGRRRRFRVCCRDEIEPIGEGYHERTIVDHARFMQRLARKKPASPARGPSFSARAGQCNSNDDIAHRRE
jgi:fluoroacetyl-CoA thioesterase